MSSSKISRETLNECVNAILQNSAKKKRKFLETVELQVALKNYDPQKDKRFSGSVRLKYVARPRMKVCILGDQHHTDEAKLNNLPYRDVEALKKLNKNKKAIKVLAKSFDAFLASESLIKQIPRILGPGLNKAGKFPTVVTHGESLVAKVEELKATVKFQMKKVLCLSVAVGHVAMAPEELSNNIALSLNFLASYSRKMSVNDTISTRLLSVKEVRYDRQLRLWGDHGQNKLELANVCLLNATTTGCEILKSLILPGIGSFTIFDGDVVHLDEGSNNYFLNATSPGEYKAKLACESLNQELNPDVIGRYVAECPKRIFATNRAAFDEFSLVIGTALSEKFALELSDRLWYYGVPLIVCKTNGLVGMIRLVVKEHCIFQSHEEYSSPDLMLDYTIPELKEYVESIDFSSITLAEMKHMPSLIWVIKALQFWRFQIGDPNAFPTSFIENTVVRAMFEHFLMKICPDESIFERIFTATKRAMELYLHQYKMPFHVSQVLQDPSAQHVNHESGMFWILSHALKQFVDNEGAGRLPLSGVLPDMESDTNRFVKLQAIFAQQAEKDASIVHGYVEKTIESLEMSHRQRYLRLIPFEKSKQFCQNASFIRVIRGQVAQVNMMRRELYASDRHFNWYLLLRAVDRFHAENDRYPGSGTTQQQFDWDKSELGKIVDSILTMYDLPKLIKPDLIDEICRYGGEEMHCTAAVIAGLAAQEAVKLLTGQYVPMVNTFIYDGLINDGRVFEL
ncbi:Nedd8-activating enzyme E1 regulatory subunit [Trichinella pseudospiralis]|uniref:Large ribosomal subunit protein uL1 n=1 Tax=Trichinella pseudospiralis TaxID=6337 RepID=A0A0V1FIM8_TRIPS|nr:Nedd8-activating enzyme E1 regulatory subunit [Trichinella pseudospiralis]